ncbi:MAG: DUF2829 domain-containing protein [Mycoplasma sp.]|nr:DUF2829 domain-containing protein [Mycoplasma sp.]
MAQFTGNAGNRETKKTFAGALLRVTKDKKKVKRDCWAEGVFIYMQEGSIIKPEQGRNEYIRELKGDVTIQPHIDMMIGSAVNIGWTPDQGDMFAEDWEVID